MTSPLGLVGAGCLLWAAAVAARWWLRRVDALGRRRTFPVWSVSLLLVLTVSALVPVALHHRQESRLSAVASELVGHRVAVTCQTTSSALVDAGGELGYVPYDERGVPLPVTMIKRDPCARLSDYTRGDKRSPSLDEVVAVHVLTHEAMHMRGQTSEAVTECQAVQRNAWTAELLGATAAQAAALSRTYWERVYPGMPSDYRSGDCSPDGALDEELVTAPWSVTTDLR